MQHVYEIRPHKDKRGVDLISDALPFGKLWYGEPNAVTNAIGYAQFYSRSHDAVIRVFDKAGVLQRRGIRTSSTSLRKPFSTWCTGFDARRVWLR